MLFFQRFKNSEISLKNNWKEKKKTNITKMEDKSLKFRMKTSKKTLNLLLKSIIWVFLIKVEIVLKKKWEAKIAHLNKIRF